MSVNIRLEIRDILMDFEIRAVIHFHYLQNIPHQSTAAKIKSMYGEASPTPNAVKY